MSWHCLSAAEVSPQPWRNGGGQTRELLAWPRPDEWLLRISVADIAADGPFSAYPGIDRWFAVLEGGGVRLGDQTLTVETPLHRFDGGEAPDCRLLSDATRDFNIMHRRGAGRVEVRPADTPCRPAGDWLACFSLAGGTLRSAGASLELPRLSLAWCDRPLPESPHFLPAAASCQRSWWIEWSRA